MPGIPDAEILHGGGRRTREGPFSQRTRRLVEEHHARQQRQRRAAEPPCGESGGCGQQYGLEQNRRQCRRGGHSEQRGVDQRRQHGGQQAHAPAVFVGSDEREEVDRQPPQAALRHQMTDLGAGRCCLRRRAPLRGRFSHRGNRANRVLQPLFPFCLLFVHIQKQCFSCGF